MHVLRNLMQVGSEAVTACRCNDMPEVMETYEDDELRGSFHRAPSVQLHELTLEYSWPELQRATLGFSESCVIGRGHIGTVYKGILEEGLDVAIKVLEGQLAPGFEDEVRLLSRCHHPNLVMLLGFGFGRTRPRPQSTQAEAADSQDDQVSRRALVYPPPSPAGELAPRPGTMAFWRVDARARRTLRPTATPSGVPCLAHDLW